MLKSIFQNKIIIRQPDAKAKKVPQYNIVPKFQCPAYNYDTHLRGRRCTLEFSVKSGKDGTVTPCLVTLEDENFFKKTEKKKKKYTLGIKGGMKLSLAPKLICRGPFFS